MVLGIKRSADDLEVIILYFVNIFFLTCIMLTDFEVYDASYDPCFFSAWILWPIVLIFVLVLCRILQHQILMVEKCW